MYASALNAFITYNLIKTGSAPAVTAPSIKSVENAIVDALTDYGAPTGSSSGAGIAYCNLVNGQVLGAGNTELTRGSTLIGGTTWTVSGNGFAAPSRAWTYVNYSFRILLPAVAVPMYFRAGVRVSGSLVTQQTFLSPINNTNFCFGGSMIVLLNAGNVVTMEIDNVTGGNITLISSIFGDSGWNVQQGPTG